MAVDDIRNFLAVSGNLATAGQPSEAQLQSVAREGFKVVINLGLLDPRYCLDDEAGRVQELGMRYVHIPVDFEAPADEDLQRFFQAMDEARDQKVLVHCAANYRVSSFVSLYGQAKLGWSEGDADAYVHRVWDPNPVWAEFINGARRHLPARRK